MPRKRRRSAIPGERYRVRMEVEVVTTARNHDDAQEKALQLLHCRGGDPRPHDTEVDEAGVVDVNTDD